MKPLIILFLSAAFFSCGKDQHVILRLVNAGNDGWDAFSIFFHDDSTYSIEDGRSDNTGRYTIKDTVIYLDGSNPGAKKILYNTTALGCMYNVRYVSNNRITGMRVIVDSLYCKGIVSKSLAGIWECDLAPYGVDTLRLNTNNSAHWRGTDYSHWEVNNSVLRLSRNDHSSYLLILDIRNDTLWYIPQITPGASVATEATKAIRLMIK